MDARITEAVAAVEEARTKLRSVMEEVQACCPHARIYHQQGRSGWLDLNTVRICADCGLEEQGGVYASNGDFVKLKSEFISTTHEATKHRVPQNTLPIRHVRHGRYYDPSKE